MLAWAGATPARAAGANGVALELPGGQRPPRRLGHPRAAAAIARIAGPVARRRDERADRPRLRRPRRAAPLTPAPPSSTSRGSAPTARRPAPGSGWRSSRPGPGAAAPRPSRTCRRGGPAARRAVRQPGWPPRPAPRARSARGPAHRPWRPHGIPRLVRPAAVAAGRPRSPARRRCWRSTSTRSRPGTGRRPPPACPGATPPTRSAWCAPTAAATSAARSAAARLRWRPRRRRPDGSGRARTPAVTASHPQVCCSPTA